MELKVYYSGKLNSELDDALEGVLSKFGLTRWASGYDLVNEVRDLAFECEQANHSLKPTGANNAPAA